MRLEWLFSSATASHPAPGRATSEAAGSVHWRDTPGGPFRSAADRSRDSHVRHVDTARASRETGSGARMPRGKRLHPEVVVVAMHITSVQVSVLDPAATARFFRDVLDLAVETVDDTPHVRIGTSTLILGRRDAPAEGYYHLAFDIPENHIVAARDLLRSRIDILPGGTDGVITGPESWNSHSVYFNAPGDLNLELIARHRRPTAAATPFSFADIFHISEVGIPVDDTISAVNDLQSTFGIEPFGHPSAMFAPMGTDDGLIILVRTGRIWLPTEDQAALPLPLLVEARGLDGTLSPHPNCTITGTA